MKLRGGKGHPVTCLYSHGGETEVYLQHIRTLEFRRQWVVSTTPRPFYPWKIPGTHFEIGWVWRGGILRIRASSSVI